MIETTRPHPFILKNMVSIICATLLLLPYTNAFSEKGSWVLGHYDCGQLLAHCDRSKRDVSCDAGTIYVLGYISGLTMGSRIPREKISVDSAKYATIKYCRENPLKDTSDAAESIFRELIK